MEPLQKILDAQFLLAELESELQAQVIGQENTISLQKAFDLIRQARQVVHEANGLLESNGVRIETHEQTQNQEDGKCSVTGTQHDDETLLTPLEKSTDAVYLRNLTTGQYEYMSPLLEQITGYSLTEMEALNLVEAMERIHPDDRDTVTAGIDQAKAEGKSIIEYRFKGKDGRYRWLTNSIHTQTHVLGEPLFRIGIIRDVSPEKQMEQSLRESEERFRLLAENIDHVFWFMDLEQGKMVYVNPAFEKIWGTPTSELYADARLWLNFIHPDDRCRVRRELEQWYQGETKEYDIEYRIVRPDKEIRWIWDQGSVIGVREGRPARICGIAKDISDRIRAYQQLEEARMEAVNDKNLLEAVLEALPVGLAIIDVNGGISRVNHTYEQLWGGPRPSTQSVSDYAAYQAWWLDSGLPVKPDEWASARAVQRCETVVGQLVEIMRFDGSRTYVHNSAAPILNARGRVVGSAVAVMDISDRIRAEKSLKQALEEAEEGRRILYALMEYVPEGLTIADAPDMKIRMVSRAGQELLGGTYYGATVDAVVGQWNIYHPDGLTPVEVQDLPMSRAIRNGETIRNEELIQINSDGSLMYLLCNAAPVLGSSGSIIGGISVWRDITDRKQAQETLRELSQRLTYHVDNSPLAVIEWGPDMRLIRWSAEAERMFGWKAEEVLGKSIDEFRWIYEEDELQVAEVISDLQKGKNPRRFSANRNYHKDGSVVHCEWYNSSLLDESGNLRSILSLVLDVTERKKAEQALRQANDELEERVAERTGELEQTVEALQKEITERRRLEQQLLQSQKMESIGVLAGGVAHDFNNLLTGISGFGQILQERIAEDDELSKESVVQLLKAADRAAELTRRLLAFSRKQVINPKPIHIDTIISSTIRLMKRIIGEDIDFSLALSSKKMLVKADTGQIEQVLMNLATNARDAMPDGGSLSISTKQVMVKEGKEALYDLAAPGKYALISISDTGSGIDKKSMERLFEPFYTTKEVGKGTGLGLSIVYGIVKQHDGSILVSSEPGKGTTFRIYLPLVMDDFVVDDQSNTPSPRAGGTETLLIVDDE